MRTTTSLAVLTAFALTACMDERTQETTPEASLTTGMEEPIEDAQALDERARIIRERAEEPPPQYGELDIEDPMEPPTYGEMQREPGELDPQYGLTQPPMGADVPPTYDSPVDAESDEMAVYIEETLRTIPSLEDDDIRVRIEGARVHLSGIVDSPMEVMQARDVVGGLPGVEEVVVDDLRVVTVR